MSVRGLYREIIKRKQPDGTVLEEERYRIDLRWREPSGLVRRHAERLPAGTKWATAKARVEKKLAEALKGGWNPKPVASKTLGEGITEFVKWAEVNRPRTLRDVKSVTAIVAEALGDGTKLDDLSPFHVERLKQARSKAGCSPATVNRAVAMLKRLCGVLASLGHMPKAVAVAVAEVKLLKEPPGRVRELAEDERASLMSGSGDVAGLNERMRLVVEAELQSGMRQGELLGLRKAQLNLKAREIILTRTKSNRVRRVPVNERLAAVLARALELSPEGCDFVFTDRRGRGWNVHTFRSNWARTRDRLGIKNLRNHDMRHDFATKVRRRGAGIDAIAAVLGHSSLAMTQRYAHIGSDIMRATVATLDDATPAPHAPIAPAEEAKENPPVRLVR